MTSKLIRDNIPEVISDQGKTVITHQATDEEYSVKLKEKLSEETAEYLESENIEELADIIEVINAILKQQGKTFEDLDKIRQSKATKNGSFTKRLILDSIKEN